MSVKKRDLFYLALAVAVVWLVVVGHETMLPFFLAAVFAYVLNPVVTLISSKIRLPRAAAIAIVYLVIIGGLALIVGTVWSRYSEESLQFHQETGSFFAQADAQVNTMPVWVQPVASDLLASARHSIILSPKRIAAFLPGAVNRLVGGLVFLVAVFYFLKDGHSFIDSLLGLLPADIKFEAEAVIRKVNRVLGNYLRGQIFLIAIMALLTFLVLSIIGVRYALSLAIFTGIAETVPFVGPVAAAVLAMIVAYTDGVSHLGLDPVLEVIFVGLAYAVLRQIEDYFIIPQVLGRMTRLHPLVILFSALLGGHLFGILGFVVAVPVVASLRVVLEHTLGLLKGQKAP